MAVSWLTEARKLDAVGLNVLPADREKKVPAMWLVEQDVTGWKRWQTERTTAHLLKWFRRDISSKMALCIVTGRISQVVVLDIDSPKAYVAWAERLGAEVLESTTYVQTQSYAKKGGGGVGHYYFRLPDADTVIRTASQPKQHTEAGVLWDLRAEGGHVVVPPSAGYKWVRGLESLQPIPDGFASVVNAFRSEAGETTTNSGRSVLSELLARMPTMGEGTGRNQLLAQVAGHYAKSFRFKDAFDAQVRMANQTFLEPVPDKEVDKLIESIWKAEDAKGLPEDKATADNGYLVHGRRELYVQVMHKDGKKFEFTYEEWADFNIEALGVVDDEGADRVYDVLVHRKRQDDEVRTQLPAKVLGEARRLRVWLAEYGVGVSQPEGAFPRMAWEERLRRWIEDQDPPHFQVVHHLGWHRGSGFVTHDGVITADGLQEFGTHRPDPRLQQWAPYHYGFNPKAVEVLREVLTFHHEEVAAVFGAWWAACFLKPQIMETASLFPFMALEAPSEAGKTTGFFALMLALAGNTKGQTAPTRAAMRDYVSAHQSGAVWIDDLDRIDHLTELLRAATGDGTSVKKGEDNSTQVEAHLVAPVVVSGEALGLRDQKALIDRAVQLEVPSPTRRKSTRDPDRLQWDDIVELKHKYPDLTIFSGTLLQEFLRRADRVKALPDFRPRSGGRWADKIAIIRLGADLLTDVTGLGWVRDAVDSWVSRQSDLGDENALTLKLIPLALAQAGMMERPLEPHDRWPMTPVLVRRGTVWVNPRLLAVWWAAHQNGRIEPRTESMEALGQQAHVLGLGGEGTRKEIRAEGGRGSSRAYYWACDEELSNLLISRALSGTIDASDRRPHGDRHEPSKATDTGVQRRLELRGGAEPEMWSTNDPNELGARLRGEEA